MSTLPPLVRKAPKRLRHRRGGSELLGVGKQGPSWLCFQVHSWFVTTDIRETKQEVLILNFYSLHGFKPCVFDERRLTLQQMLLAMFRRGTCMTLSGVWTHIELCLSSKL